MQDRNPGVGVWSCGQGRNFFPEREYVHSGQAWLWSFPNISKECRAGPGESVMAEHRATKQKVWRHILAPLLWLPGSVGITRGFLPRRIEDCRLVMTPRGLKHDALSRMSKTRTVLLLSAKDPVWQGSPWHSGDGEAAATRRQSQPKPARGSNRSIPVFMKGM
jgi:hypothetical protein